MASKVKVDGKQLDLKAKGKRPTNIPSQQVNFKSASFHWKALRPLSLYNGI